MRIEIILKCPECKSAERRREILLSAVEWDEDDWEYLPDYLYDAIIKFKKEWGNGCV